MSFLLRTTTLVRQRLFTTSTRARNVISMEDAAAAHMTTTGTNTVPKLGRVARWYLPTMAAVAVGTIYFQNLTTQPSSTTRRALTLGDANATIGFGVTNALNDANRRAYASSELTQEQKNQRLMDLYGERASLEDMERAIAGLERKEQPRDRRQALMEAYGDKASLEDLQRAMEIYEVQ